MKNQLPKILRNHLLPSSEEHANEIKRLIELQLGTKSDAWAIALLTPLNLSKLTIQISLFTSACIQKSALRPDLGFQTLRQPRVVSLWLYEKSTIKSKLKLII